MRWITTSSEAMRSTLSKMLLTARCVCRSRDREPCKNG